MEQKLYYLDAFNHGNTGSGEIVFPQDLRDLMKEGWAIKQVSSFGYCTNYGNLVETCVLLLQKETAN